MQVISSQKMFGYPVLEIREFMRVCEGFEWQLDFVAARFKIEREAASKLVRDMLRDGLISKAGLRLNSRTYELTTKGLALSMARAAKPIKRATADRLVSEFLQRVKQVNNDPSLLYWIDEVVVFGSFLTNSPTLSDVDLAVTYTERVDPDLWDDFAGQRVEIAVARGRKFRNIFEEILWPLREITLRLHQRAWALHIHEFSEDQEFVETIPHQRIYLRQPIVCPACNHVVTTSQVNSSNSPSDFEDSVNVPS